MPNLVVLFGPPAVGKAAVGHELAAVTGYRFFHNHLTADASAALFGWGTERFGRTVEAVRELLLQEAAGDPSIPGVIFTYVWNLNDPAEASTMAQYAGYFEATGGKAYFAELSATLEQRVAREGTPFRLGLKPSQRDVPAARERQITLANRYRMNTDGQFPLQHPYVFLNTEDFDPPPAAKQIAKAFSLGGTGDA